MGREIRWCFCVLVPGDQGADGRSREGRGVAGRGGHLGLVKGHTLYLHTQKGSPVLSGGVQETERWQALAAKTRNWLPGWLFPAATGRQTNGCHRNRSGGAQLFFFSVFPLSFYHSLSLPPFLSPPNALIKPQPLLSSPLLFSLTLQFNIQQLN